MSENYEYLYRLRTAELETQRSGFHHTAAVLRELRHREEARLRIPRTNCSLEPSIVPHEGS
jgi:hypothetical protein